MIRAGPPALLDHERSKRPENQHCENRTPFRDSGDILRKRVDKHASCSVHTLTCTWAATGMTIVRLRGISNSAATENARSLRTLCAIFAFDVSGSVAPRFPHLDRQ